MRVAARRVLAVCLLLVATRAFGQGHAPSGTSGNAQSVATPSGVRTLRVAIVQMQSLNHDVDGNLKKATTFAETAAAQGAKLVLYPEMMPNGSYLAFDSWDTAEPSNGKTVRWLKATSGRLHIYLGAGFFEADGEDFYDTFVLTTPEGEEAGRVRKQIAAEAEGYFFRGYTGSHVISTAIGRIGVGICAENYYCFVPTLMRIQSADLILMPHSSPDMSETGGLRSPPGTRLALWYSKNLGIPVAMVNKVGRSYKPPPNEIKGFFPGLSAIVDSDGKVLQSMDDKEGIGIADVTLDPGRKRGAATGAVCTGGGIAELTIGGSAGSGEVAKSQDLGRQSYEANPFRKAKAQAISGGGTNTTTDAK
jgi:N-carbamoylputrescine amidase